MSDNSHQMNTRSKTREFQNEENYVSPDMITSDDDSSVDEKFYAL